MVDREQMARFRSGDPDAVRVVYRELGPMVFAVAYRILGSRELAEEAAQETFVKAWRAAATFDPDRDPKPWLATIARRTAIDVHRRTARAHTVPFDELVSAAEADDDDARADVWAVREAIDDLPAVEREVVRLHHLEGLSQSEIAARLDVPLGTVKSRSFRAHRLLAERLGHLRDVVE